MNNQLSSNLSEEPLVQGKKENSTARFSRIYKTIRERISLLQYPPGSILNEAELSAEFGVSRTPLRSVLQRLYHEGLVVITNGVGTIVTDIDMKTFKDIYDMRILLAENMGKFSPKKIEVGHIDTLGQLVSQAEALYSDKDIQKYALICNQLEEVILDLIGSVPLRDTTDVLYYRVARIWLTFLPNMNWDDEIRALVTELNKMEEALKNDDLTAFGQVRSQGLRTILQRISIYLSGA